MQDLIKRNFWVLGAVVAMTCAVFAAKGAMPHKYKENGTQINAVGAVQINLTPSEERL